MEDYKIAFEFMFYFVESMLEFYPDDPNVELIYKIFFEKRKDLEV